MATRPRSQVKPLTVREVHAAREGEHSEGLGLLLRVHGDSAQWVFRFTSPNGRRREMGLGVCQRTSPAAAGRSLITAREQADAARAQLLMGTDTRSTSGTLNGRPPRPTRKRKGYPSSQRG
jgi:hypothetical protein